MKIQPVDVPVFILCGGFGTRIQAAGEFLPKPMLTVGNEPIMIHIMRTYSKYGFRRFILSAGFKADVIFSYFYSLLHSKGVTFSFNEGSMKIDSSFENMDWEVSIVDTGINTMTGARVALAADKYLGNASHFAVTYGDGLTDVNLREHLEFHLSKGKVGTVLAVSPPSQFGQMAISGDNVNSFLEKPKVDDNWINGGFFFFQRVFRDYLSSDKECVLEQAPLTKLASEGELCVNKYKGFWQCMDTQKDRDYLNSLYNSGNAKWI